MMHPSTLEDVRAAVRDCPPGSQLLPRGGGTKPALSTIPNYQLLITNLQISSLSGVLEYEPSEFTFTALAGTPITEVTALLDEHGQYLPFDPLLVARGATLGGTVAAGISGPGRYRYGGVRDFLIGVRFVDGEGRLVRGGGKVVKNAAGFDLPKLMVGSLGGLGVLVELTFKVFPKPEAHTMLRLACGTLDDALQALYRLQTARLDVDAVDIEMQSETTAWVRLAGLAKALPARLERLRGVLDGGDVIEGVSEAGLWRRARELEWVPPGWTLLKAPLTPRRIPTLEASLEGREAMRRYSSGGQVAWIASPERPQEIDALLSSQGLAGLALYGPPGTVRLGVRPGEAFARRVKQALDPSGRFAAND